MGKPDRPERPDIEIASGARAKRLRFDEAPEVDIDVWAEPSGETGSGSDRTRLPDRVRPGVDYTDIEIDQRIAARADPQRVGRAGGDTASREDPAEDDPPPSRD